MESIFHFIFQLRLKFYHSSSKHFGVIQMYERALFLWYLFPFKMFFTYCMGKEKANQNG